MEKHESALNLQEQIKQLIDQLAAIARTYKPSAETLEKIRDKKLVCLIGATAVGKSSLMKEAIKDSEYVFSEVYSFTTRESRGEGDNYHFYKKTIENLQMLVKRAQNGEMVNLFVHPDTGDVYGTWPEDFKEGINVLGATSQSFSKIAELPLDIKVIAIITDPEVWKKRIDEREDLTLEQRKLRAHEAEISLNWCLEKYGVLFVNNSGPLAKTVESIIQILDGSPPDQEECRELAREMLKVAKLLQL